MGSRVVFVAFVIILFHECVLQAFGLSAKEFFDQTDANLQLVVKMVEENDRNGCSLLKTCSAVGNCSRQDCLLDVTDLPNYDCGIVNSSKYCPSAGCNTTRNLNFQKSYISLSDTTDMSSNETTWVICTQRVLDDEAFRLISNKTNSNVVFYGSVEGSFRIFPGMDELTCSAFEARVRPWFLAALYVRKVVMVVVDIGYSMGEPMLAGVQKSQSPLSMARNLTEALMSTLSGFDCINVIVYNSSDAILLAPTPLTVNDSNSDTYPPTHPEFDPLRTKLMNTVVGSANAVASNLSLAMDKTISNLSPFDSAFVKIVIVLTDGALGDSESPMWKNLKDARVKVFVQKFPNPGGTDISITEQAHVCSIGGSYEFFPMTRRHNPLFALQSYYSFIANVRTKMNNSLVYGYEYIDYFKADSSIFTISQSGATTIDPEKIYDSDGVLLGVVGIDVHKSDVRTRLGISEIDFETETARRRIAYTFNATRDLVLDSTTCSNQTSAAVHDCGSDTVFPPNGSLCPANDQGKDITKFSCCGNCTAPTQKESKNTLTIGLGVTGSVAFLGSFCGMIFLGVRRFNQQRKLRIADPGNIEFPGGEDTSLAREASMGNDLSPPDHEIVPRVNGASQLQGQT